MATYRLCRLRWNSSPPAISPIDGFAQKTSIKKQQPITAISDSTKASMVRMPKL